MEDLQSLMTCLDDISNKIGDGMYLDMADKLKRVHDHMNGNKPFHEDTFYYSDDDSELDSDDDSDSDYEVSEPDGRDTRLMEIDRLRDQLLDVVKKMHQEYKLLMKCEKEAKRKDWTPIKRMTAFRKSQAIKQWCEKNVRWAPGGEAGELVGHISTAAAYHSWTWKNLMENGLRTIVLEIGTEEDIIRAQRGFVYYDELSLKTLQKLPAFEKKIYDDYKEECQRKMTEYFNNAKLKVVESKAKMTGFEMFCREREDRLRELGAPVFARDYWESATCEFWTGDQMVANGWEARVEHRR
jgi:hypothetical protein